MNIRSSYLIALALCPVGRVTGSSCERLKASLTYTQEEAPRDLSALLPVVVEKVNRVLDGVVDVEVEWNGADLHGRVGEHIVQCKVTRLASAISSENLDVVVDGAGREVTSQCFHVPFTILDTNECMLAKSHPMRHKCQAPAMCVNTIGSYDCLCPTIEKNTLSIGNIPSAADDQFWLEIDASPRTAWEMSYNSRSRTSCPSQATTHGCCSEKAHSADGVECRKRFQCPNDPCRTKTDCDQTAVCVREPSPAAIPNHRCVCPDGLMGNGYACRPGIDPKPEPKVTFDGVTPTELTLKNNLYCGCHEPIVDACSGFPPCKGKHEVCTASAGSAPSCACKPGYVMHETFGCVDIHPPTLKLRHDPHGDQSLRLKQGEEYREYMVDIIDENAEDYLRSLKISYSEPLPPGCLTKVGEFHVNYTVATPWTTPSFVRVTRRVVIEDINECKLDAAKFERSCPILVPQCDTVAGATCVNTVGSYKCQCPQNSIGDGFKRHSFPASSGSDPKMSLPTGFKGGTSCVDTSRPVISLKGPNPKVFKTCEFGGLSGVLNSAKAGDEEETMKAIQRRQYEGNIKELIASTAGAELCATAGSRRPSPSDCMNAIDHTYKGDVDLSGRVVVGEPIQKSPLHWVVPYDVTDDAGNEATTVWRDVIVQEFGLSEVESKIRQDVEREHQAEMKQAVQKAISEEKVKWERENKKVGATGRRKTQSCPACPKCDCPSKSDVKIDRAACQQYCDTVAEQCTINDDNVAYTIIFWLEDLFPSWLVPFVVFAALCAGILFILRWIVALIFSPREYQSYNYGSYGDRGTDSDLLRQPDPMAQAATPVAPSRREPQSNTRNSNNEAFFSPQISQTTEVSTPMFNGNGITGTPRALEQQGHGLDESIYQTPSIISPSRTGDGVRRRSPYR